jgi:hypothetical protein
MPGEPEPGLAPPTNVGPGEQTTVSKPRNGNELLTRQDAPLLAGVKVVRPRLRLRALHLDPDSSLARARTQDPEPDNRDITAYGRNGLPTGDPLTKAAPSKMPICAAQDSLAVALLRARSELNLS